MTPVRSLDHSSASPTALATILWLIALRKEKLDVSFWSFLKVGALAMPVALLLSIGGAILMQMCFGTL